MKQELVLLWCKPHIRYDVARQVVPVHRTAIMYLVYAGQKVVCRSCMQFCIFQGQHALRVSCVSCPGRLSLLVCVLAAVELLFISSGLTFSVSYVDVHSGCTCVLDALRSPLTSQSVAYREMRHHIATGLLGTAHPDQVTVSDIRFVLSKLYRLK